MRSLASMDAFGMFMMKTARSFKVLALPVFLLLIPISEVIAETATKKNVQPSAVSGGQVLQLITALIGIVALIVIMAWLVRRTGRINVNANASFRILSMVPMGARERIVLMQVGEQQLLIGVSQQGGIRTLHVLEKNIDIGAAGEGGGFQDKLRGLLDRGKSS